MDRLLQFIRDLALLPAIWRRLVETERHSPAQPLGFSIDPRDCRLIGSATCPDMSWLRGFAADLDGALSSAQVADRLAVAESRERPGEAR